MHGDALPHYLALFGSIALIPTAHVLLKLGATAGRGLLASFLNPRTIAGYGLMGAATVLSVFAFQRIELKTGAALVSLSYPLVILLSRLVLKEPLTRNRLLGSALIVGGIVVFYV